MVVVCHPAVAPVIVQLPNLVSHIPAVVCRIENRNPVGRQRHRPTLEVARGNRNRCRRRHRHQRKPPVIGLAVANGGRVSVRIRRARKIGSRQRDLLLPCGDPHHLVRHPVRHVVRLDKKCPGIPVIAHLGFEGPERGAHERSVPRRGNRLRRTPRRRHSPPQPQTAGNPARHPASPSTHPTAPQPTQPTVPPCHHRASRSGYQPSLRPSPRFFRGTEPFRRTVP